MGIYMKEPTEGYKRQTVVVPNHCVVEGHFPSTGDKGPLQYSKGGGEAITTPRLRNATVRQLTERPPDIMEFNGRSRLPNLIWRKTLRSSVPSFAFPDNLVDVLTEYALSNTTERKLGVVTVGRLGGRLREKIEFYKRVDYGI